MSDLPDEPLSELYEGAIQLHEAFQAYCSAGFSDDHAIALTQTLLWASVQASE